MTNRAEQSRRIVELWSERPSEQRTGADILTFYRWLSEHQPELIPSGPGSYQQMWQILSKHISDANR